jgi:hypothetical protein
VVYCARKMSLSYTILPQRCRVLVVATAKPTLEEFIGVHEAFLADPRFEPGMDILWDRRAYNEAPDTDYIRAIIAYWKANQARLGGGYVATAVPEGVPAAYGMARMAETLGRPEGELRAFNDFDEAVGWLDERFEQDGTRVDGPRPCSSR